MWLMIKGKYKKHFKEIHTKNRVWNYYFDNLLKAKELQGRIILVDEKSISISWFIWLDTFTRSR